MQNNVGHLTPETIPPSPSDMFLPSAEPLETELTPVPKRTVATPFSLGNKTALVTGAARGIGRAVVARLTEEGVKVVALDKNTDALHLLADEFGCEVCTSDLAECDPELLANNLLDKFTTIPLIVNCAAATSPHGFLELNETDFDVAFTVNVRSPWFLTRRLTERLVAANEPGSIVFIGSLHTQVRRNQPHYSASKAAVRMLVKEMAGELASHNIRVNMVSPGWITDQPGNREHPQIPSGEGGWPDDVARVVVALLSDWTNYVTGADWKVDGGLGLHSWVDDNPSPDTFDFTD